jgi:CBS domain-containing protein
MALTTEYAVADLMTVEPIVVEETRSVEHAEELMRTYRVSGLPVVDESGRLVGVFSQTDVLYLSISPAGERLGGHLRRRSVGEVMSRPAITVNTMASVVDAADVMIEHDVHRLVAVDDLGRPIGVLSAMDFVRLAAER